MPNLYYNDCDYVIADSVDAANKVLSETLGLDVVEEDCAFTEADMVKLEKMVSIWLNEEGEVSEPGDGLLTTFSVAEWCKLRSGYLGSTEH